MGGRFMNQSLDLGMMTNHRLLESIGQNPELSIEFGFWQDLRNSTRKFRRNLGMWIFPKFFKASLGFLENTICHAMNATLGQIKLRKPFP
jgi:hypothetical protein